MSKLQYFNYDYFIIRSCGIMDVKKTILKFIQPWVVGLVIVVYGIIFLWVDKPLAIYLHQLNLGEHFPWLYRITNWGDKSRALIFLLLVPLFFRYVWVIKRYEYKAWFVWLSVAFTGAVSLVLKLMLGRARPYLLFNDSLYGFYGFHVDKFYWSLPSGHVATIMAMMFSLMILFPRLRWVFGIFGMIVMATRVLLTYHFLSDVLLTAYMTWFCVGGVYFAMQIMTQKNIDLFQYKVEHE